MELTETLRTQTVYSIMLLHIHTPTSVSYIPSKNRSIYRDTKPALLLLFVIVEVKIKWKTSTVAIVTLYHSRHFAQ